MSEGSLLSDDLLRQLIAVGEVDVLVGLPTLNHADTVDKVARAVHFVFNNHFARERTVLINCDGGSTDGTPDIVRNAAVADGESLLDSQSLRTRHRISAPYHGVPGKVAAIRTIFASADLLQARAVVVLDPEIVSVTPDSIAALIRPIWSDGKDFVSPVYERHPLDGPLITQVIRPLFRSAYGLRLREPLAGELGCSGRFAVKVQESPDWSSDDLRVAIDLWLSGMAAFRDFRVAEVRLGPRQLAQRSRPGVSTLVPEILDAIFTCLRLHEEDWTARSEFVTVPLHEGIGGSASPPPSIDAQAYDSVFHEGMASLGSMLQPALRQETFAALQAAASADRIRISDELWISVLCEIAAAHRRAEQSRGHLLSAVVPLYLGRVAGFMAEADGASREVVEERLEALCLHFEWFKPQLVSLWTASTR